MQWRRIWGVSWRGARGSDDIKIRRTWMIGKEEAKSNCQKCIGSNEWRRKGYTDGWRTGKRLHSGRVYGREKDTERKPDEREIETETKQTYRQRQRWEVGERGAWSWWKWKNRTRGSKEDIWRIDSWRCRERERERDRETERQRDRETERQR